MNVQIRIATPNDTGTLRTLMQELVTVMGEQFVEKRFEWGIQRRLYDPLQKHGLFIGEDMDDNKRPVGMIFAEIRVDPFGRSEGYIKQFIVTKNYRGKGVGDLLLRSAMEHLQKINVEKVLINVKKEVAKAVDILGKKFHFKEKYAVMEILFDATDHQG